MNNKFIRVISPFTVAMVAVLNASVIYCGVLTVQKIVKEQSLINLSALGIILTVFVVAVFVSKSIFTAGVKFDDFKMEFTAIDTDNVFEYGDIERVEIKRDDKPSFTKNFNSRHSYIILHLKEDRIATIDLGLTTKRTLLKIEKEIKERKG